MAKKKKTPAADFASLTESAVGLWTARRAFGDVWIDYGRRLQTLPPDQFWVVADHYTRLVLERYSYKDRDIIGHAADELFRLEATGQSPFDIHTLVRFALTWAEWDGDLHERLSNVVSGYSDDRFGDLTDALPLAGREFCETKFATNDQFVKALKQLPKPTQKLVTDELYVGSTLEKHAKRRVLYKVADSPAAKKLPKAVRDAAYDDEDE